MGPSVSRQLRIVARKFMAAFDPDHSNNADRIIALLITDVTISEPDRFARPMHVKHGQTDLPLSFFVHADRAARSAVRSGAMAEKLDMYSIHRAPEDSDDEGQAIAAAANKYWAAFAKTGNPDSAGGATGRNSIANDEALLEFPAGGVPIAQKHFHLARLDWV